MPVSAQFVVTIPDEIQLADMTLKIQETARPTLEGYVSKLTGNNKYFRQMVDRADAYLPIVERIFQEEGLPVDFRYLVIQESSLVSNQVSSSNAVGYWQFKKETATEMGLRVDAEIDERMNIVSSSRSAARYLIRHNQYMQNWTYSLLAYYAGLGGARTLINPEKIGSKTLDIDDKTHWYILKFIAHKIAFEPHLYRNTATPSLRVMEYADCENKSVEQLAKETGYPQEQIQFYNRWILNTWVPSDRDYTLILPVKGGETGTDPALYTKVSPPVEQLGPWREKVFFGLIEKPVVQPEPVVLANGQTEIPVFFDWNGIKAIQARKGDNAARLALLGGISRDQFLEYNDLRVFDNLVPGEVYYVDDKKRKSRIPYHTVKYGESLWDVAQKYGLKMKSLMAKNRMKNPEKLRPGRVLWLRHTRPEDEPVRYEPVPEVKPLDILAAKPSLRPADTARTPAPQPVSLKQVEAQARAILGADTNSEEAPETAAAPAISLPSGRPSGQLSDPGAGSTALASTAPGIPAPARPEGPGAIEREARTVVRAGNPVNGRIEVVPGITWYQISRQFRKPLDSLYFWNGGTGNSLQPGMQVWVENPLASPRRTAETPAVTSASGPESTAGTYEVQAGDSVYGIARRFGMKPARLLELNDKSDATLRPGEILKVDKPE